jgi:hypothetical protein
VYTARYRGFESRPFRFVENNKGSAPEAHPPLAENPAPSEFKTKIKIMQNLEEYQSIRNSTQNFYNQKQYIRCPALNNEMVHFTSEGFNHLVYKNDRNERDKGIQIMKFKLLPRAVEIIGLSTTYQEYDENIKDIRKKKHKKIVCESAVVKYWGLVAVIRNTRVKVIIRQIGNGQKHFWSVIPAWKKCHYRDTKFISNALGDLEND